MSATAYYRPADRLIAAHGTLDEFATACRAAVPGYISKAEADRAVEDYAAELRAAERAGLIHQMFVDLLNAEGRDHSWKEAEGATE